MKFESRLPNNINVQNKKCSFRQMKWNEMWEQTFWETTALQTTRICKIIFRVARSKTGRVTVNVDNKIQLWHDFVCTVGVWINIQNNVDRKHSTIEYVKSELSILKRLEYIKHASTNTFLNLKNICTQFQCSRTMKEIIGNNCDGHATSHVYGTLTIEICEQCGHVPNLLF